MTPRSRVRLLDQPNGAVSYWKDEWKYLITDGEIERFSKRQLRKIARQQNKKIIAEGINDAAEISWEPTTTRTNRPARRETFPSTTPPCAGCQHNDALLSRYEPLWWLYRGSQPVLPIWHRCAA